MAGEMYSVLIIRGSFELKMTGRIVQLKDLQK